MLSADYPCIKKGDSYIMVRVLVSFTGRILVKRMVLRYRTWQVVKVVKYGIDCDRLMSPSRKH